MGQLRPRFVTLPHSGDDISCASPSPLRHRRTNLILFTMLQFLSLPEDYYLPDKLHCFFPANMNKQALCFLSGQRAWLNESENPKKDCLPPVHQLPDNYSRASCKENRWRASANNAGLLRSGKGSKAAACTFSLGDRGEMAGGAAEWRRTRVCGLADAYDFHRRMSE